MPLRGGKEPPLDSPDNETNVGGAYRLLTLCFDGTSHLSKLYYVLYLLSVYENYFLRVFLFKFFLNNKLKKNYFYINILK